MRIRYIREFVALSECGSFTTAAMQMGITQTALSRHLQQMEQEIGAELLTRSTRKMKLTAEGKCFIEYAKETLAVYTEMTDALAQLDTAAMQTEQIRVSTAQNIGVYGLDRFYMDFAVQNPEIICTMMQADGPNLVESIQRNECDAGFTFCINQEMLSQPDIDYYPLDVEDEFVAAIPSQHALASEGSIDVHQLIKETFIKLPTTTVSSLYCKQLCQKAGFHPRTGLRALREPDVLSYLQGSPSCVALMFRKPAEFAIERKHIANIELHSLSPKAKARMYFICRKDDNTYATKAMIHAILENLSPRKA